MKWYPWYPSDYLSKTLGLSDYEDLAYRRLLDSYYAAGKPVDHDRRYNMARASTPEMQSAVDYVLERFFQRVENSWTHRRVEEEIQRTEMVKAQRSEAGKRGMSKRWKKQIDNNPVTGDKAELSQTDNKAITGVITELYQNDNGEDNKAIVTTTTINTKNITASPCQEIDAKAQLFDTPLKWLISKGLPESHCRSLLGKILKETGDENSALEIAKAVAEADPLDPPAYIAAALKWHKRERERVEKGWQAFGYATPAQPYRGQAL